MGHLASSLSPLTNATEPVDQRHKAYSQTSITEYQGDTFWASIVPVHKIWYVKCIWDHVECLHYRTWPHFRGCPEGVSEGVNLCHSKNVIVIFLFCYSSVVYGKLLLFLSLSYSCIFYRSMPTVHRFIF